MSVEPPVSSILTLRSALKRARLVPMYLVSISKNMGVSKNRGTPKWMVCNGTPYQNG